MPLDRPALPSDSLSFAVRIRTTRRSRTCSPILSVKLDLSARLPVFEYEADSEGFSDTASFLSSLASAERESLQDVLTSLRLHLDRTAGRFTPGATS